MPNYANLTLSGHLGKDAEVKMSQSGNPIVSFSVAFSQGKKGDPNPKPATWFRCRAVGAAAHALQDCRKGEAVEITKAIPETWKDRDGNERVSWTVFEAKKWERKEQEQTTSPSTYNPDDDIPF